MRENCDKTIEYLSKDNRTKSIWKVMHDKMKVHETTLENVSELNTLADSMNQLQNENSFDPARQQKEV